MDDIIEFYDGDNLIAAVRSSMVPPVGSFISIEGKTWRVANVTYALDYAMQREKRMRCNVDLEAAK